MHVYFIYKYSMHDKLLIVDLNFTDDVISAEKEIQYQDQL